MSADDELARQEEMLAALQADQRRRAAEREEIARRAVEARAAISPALQARLDAMAARESRYSVGEFFKALYNMLPDRLTTFAAITMLFEYYMAMHDVQNVGTSHADWGNYGVGPLEPRPRLPPPPMAPPDDGWGFFAPAAPEESVVEAVFAKRRKE